MKRPISEGLAIYESQVKGIVPRYTDRFETVEVEVSTDNDMFTTYVESSYFQMNATLMSNGGSLPFTKEQWTEYLRYAVYQRVAYVTNQPCDFRPKDRMLVPHFLSVILQNVGVAREETLGIEVKPKLPAEKPGMTKGTALMISNSLSILERHGFTFATEYSRAKDGDWSLMSMMVIDGFVRAHSDASHPVYATMASLLMYDCQLSKVITPRITYGSVEQYRAFVSVFAGPRVS